MDADLKTLELDKDAPRRSMQRLVLPWVDSVQHGDCLQIMAEMPAACIDAIVTDPPYCSGGVSEASRSAAKGQGLRSENIGRFGWFVGDNMGTAGLVWLLRNTALECHRLLKADGSMLMFCDWRMIPNIVPAAHYSVRGETSKSLGDLSILEHYFRGLLREIFDCLTPEGVAYVFCDGQSYPIFHRVGYSQWKRIRPLIWDKGTSVNGYAWRHQHELIAYMEKDGSPKVPTGDGDVIRESAVKVADREHLAEKPSKLIMRLIQKSTKEGQTILDPFAGCGSALLAARDCGRKAIGIEMEEKYCDIAKRRIHGEAFFGEVNKALSQSPENEPQR